MTGQIADCFRYQGRDVSIVEIRNGELFTPSFLHLEPSSPNTACWRGYVARFGLSDSNLVLDILHIHLMTKNFTHKKGPTINTVNPIYFTAKRMDKENEWFNNKYEGLGYHLSYTGSLLLGEGFISDLYFHGGFQSAWKYKKVIELIFVAGILRQEFDRSEEMAELRNLLNVKESKLNFSV